MNIIFNILKKNYSLQVLLVCILILSAVNALAGDPVITPKQTEGPFYPDKFPADTDNDLLVINNSAAKAKGDIVHLTGVVMDAEGKPIKNAAVEIWQADSNMVYLHRNINQKESLQPEFVPLKNRKNEYSVNFNIVIGAVSENPKKDNLRYMDGSLTR